MPELVIGMTKFIYLFFLKRYFAVLQNQLNNTNFQGSFGKWEIVPWFWQLKTLSNWCYVRKWLKEFWEPFIPPCLANLILENSYSLFHLNFLPEFTIWKSLWHLISIYFPERLGYIFLYILQRKCFSLCFPIIMQVHILKLCYEKKLSSSESHSSDTI